MDNENKYVNEAKDKYCKLDPRVPGIFGKFEKAFSLWAANEGITPFDLFKHTEDDNFGMVKTGFEAYEELKYVLEDYEKTVYKQTEMLEELQKSVKEMNRNIENLSKKVNNKNNDFFTEKKKD